MSDEHTVEKVAGTAIDRERLEASFSIARHSPDPSTQNGALLIFDSGSTLSGCNQPDPQKLAGRDFAALTREERYVVVIHAEEDVILAAREFGLDTTGATLYCPWYACEQCAAAIIEAGITRCVGNSTHLDRTPERWRQPVDKGLEMLRAAGVQCDWYDGSLTVPALRFDGQLVDFSRK